MRSYTRPAFLSEYEDDYEHPKVLELEQRIDHSIEWFEEVCAILYGKKPFDLDDLENCLDELSSHLGCKIPSNNLQVTLNQKTA
jgi:hypothetical protein